MAEMLSWEELSAKQKGLGGLGGMYGAYLAVGELFLDSVSEKWSLCREERGHVSFKLTFA